MPGANHPDLTALLARMESLGKELGLVREELERTKAEHALAVIQIKRKDRIIEGSASGSSDQAPRSSIPPNSN